MKSLHTLFFIFVTLFLSPSASAQTIPLPCTNSDQVTIEHRYVIFNEVLPRDSTNTFWLELYNCDSSAIQLEGWHFLVEPDSIAFVLQGDLLIEPNGMVSISIHELVSLENTSIQMFNDTFGFEYGFITSSMHINESTGRCGAYWLRQIPSIGSDNTCQPFVTAIVEPLNTAQIKKVDYYDISWREAKFLTAGIYFRKTTYLDGTISVKRIGVP